MRISVTQLRSLILAINLVLAGGLVYKALAAHDLIALAFGEVILEPHPAKVELRMFGYKADVYGSGPDPAAAVIRVSSDLQPQKAELPAPVAPPVTEMAEEEDEGPSTPEELPEGPLGKEWEYVYYIAWHGGSGSRNFAQIRKKQVDKPSSKFSRTSSKTRRTSTVRRTSSTRRISSKYKKKRDAVSFLVSDREIENEDFELHFWVHSADKERLVYWMPGRPSKRYALPYKHEGTYLAQGPMRKELRPEEDETEEGDEEEKKKSFYIIQEDANPEEARERRYAEIIAEKISESKFGPSMMGKSSKAGGSLKASAGSGARTSTKPTAEDIKQLKDAINKIPKNKQAELRKMLRGNK